MKTYVGNIDISEQTLIDRKSSYLICSVSITSLPQRSHFTSDHARFVGYKLLLDSCKLKEEMERLGEDQDQDAIEYNPVFPPYDFVYSEFPSLSDRRSELSQYFFGYT